jgi:putative FmdB family regulatory protein
MPIYEYSCKKCGKTIERIRKFSDPPLRKHPGCGGTLTKLISQSAFQFKGSGWYVTDYAKAGSESKGEDAGENAGEKASGAAASEASGTSETSPTPETPAKGEPDEGKKPEKRHEKSSKDKPRTPAK